MGHEASLDSFIKKFTIIYGSVKSFVLQMRNFHKEDLEDEEIIPSFANRVEGLLSTITKKFPKEISSHKEQRLLRNRFFHGSRKDIRDSVKYCYADARIDYLSFLEECRKAKEKMKATQVKQCFNKGDKNRINRAAVL